MNTTKTVLDTIVRHDLLPRGCRIVVGVSGGGDSMALLAILHDLAETRNWTLVVAHVRYGIRGIAAQEDATRVRAYCAAHDIPFHLRDLATAPHPADEAWMRDARYVFFEEVRAAVDAERIAVGHTRDDLAETVLLHLLRGTGLTGLTGMGYRRERIVRPLLNATHAATTTYCRSLDIPYGEDATNADTAYLRNRIRHELLPLLAARYNPSITDALVRTAHLVGDDLAALTTLAAPLIPPAHTTADGAVTFSAAAIAALPVAVQRIALRSYLAAIGAATPDAGTVAALRAAVISIKSKPQTVRAAALLLTRKGDTVKLAPPPDDGA